MNYTILKTFYVNGKKIEQLYVTSSTTDNDTSTSQDIRYRINMGAVISSNEYFNKHKTK
jgi:hypothetical protein